MEDALPEPAILPDPMPPRFLLRSILLLSLLAPAVTRGIDFPGGLGSAPDGEIIIVSGGPALREWEDLRSEETRHDRWWGNFVRTARIRMEQIRAEKGPRATITWLVYRTGYDKRSIEDKDDHISKILSVRDKDTIRCRLLWFDATDELIDYINHGGHGVSRANLKIAGFEYFGHSNKYCFTFDYSGEVLGASKVFLHQDDLSRINRGAFARNARCKSWGCHTGESMSQVWRTHTGTRMAGAIGKTDYSHCWNGTLPVISTPGGRWTR